MTILSTHNRIRKFFLVSVISFFLFAAVIMYAHVLFINAVYTISVRDALLLFVFFPLHLFYVAHGKL